MNSQRKDQAKPQTKPRLNFSGSFCFGFSQVLLLLLLVLLLLLLLLQGKQVDIASYILYSWRMPIPSSLAVKPLRLDGNAACCKIL